MAGTPFHIVITEDDEDDVFLLTDALRSLGGRQIKISNFSNGLDLLNYLHKTTTTPDAILPHVILLDINMPVLDGFDTLKRIKSDDKLKRLPVYIVTTLRDMDRLEKGLELGANNFFTKPNHVGGYRKIVEEVMQDQLFAMPQAPEIVK